jgi:predicted AlkP superfamily phosphohydrolase/phosphomutase
MFRFLSRESWDLFVAHIMDTDRLHHFLWGDVEGGHVGYQTWFNRFYERVDDVLGELVERLDDDVVLMILSDHGFCTLKKEVHLNYWLRQTGFLEFGVPAPKQLRDLAPSTRCYSLLPGRFYVCVQGREYNGCVQPGSEYETVRQDLAAGLMEIRDFETGDRVIDRVWMREEVFDGPAFDVAPDLIALPAKGYDLKGGFEKEMLLERSPVNGTHTFDDAMLYINQPGLGKEGLTVMDVMPTLFDLMDMPVPDEVDGQSIVEPL